MLMIRKEQKKAFEDAALRRFESDMERHIKQFVPYQSKSIGDHAVRKIIQNGILRAKDYNFTNRGTVCLFIEIIFILGGHFDSDPQYSWAADILSDIEITDQMERADRLYIALMDYMEKVMGPKDENERIAFKTLIGIDLEKFPRYEEGYREDAFEKDMLKYLSFIYPEKCMYANEQVIKKSICNSLSLALHHIPFCSLGPALFSIMTFFLGHKCFMDTQFPYIEEILNNKIDDAEKAYLLDLWMRGYIKNLMAQD